MRGSLPINGYASIAYIGNCNSTIKFIEFPKLLGERKWFVFVS
jgi:hypothetical protein